MSTVRQIEDAISQLATPEILELRDWINHLPQVRHSGLAAELDEAGWLASADSENGHPPALESGVMIEGEPLSETIIRERR